jgi:hypothetical protein
VLFDEFESCLNAPHSQGVWFITALLRG